MAVLDTDQLTEVQNKTLEDVNFTSGLWTLAEVQQLFIQRQNRFNRDTKLMLAVEDVAVANGSVQFNMPQDWIATQRVAWKSGSTGIYSPVNRSSRFAAARGILSTGAPTKPTLFDDLSGGTLTAELFPPPTEDGVIRLLYASILEPLFTNYPAVPDIFDIPDDFVPYVTYGVLSDMLSKDGRGRDLFRAQYCQSRYEEGVALAAILLGGFL